MTRARVLNYWRKHGPCTIGQVCRATGADRSHVYRILKSAYGCDFRAVGRVEPPEPYPVALAA